MKRLMNRALDAKAARVQWNEYVGLLRSKQTLSEAKDILPFFGRRDDLCLLMSHYIPAFRKADLIAHEFPIYGDFRADLIIGDSTTGNFVLVEFEDATPQSIFEKVGTRSTLSWARRFEGAFSQLIDWLWKLEDMRHTRDFENVFGSRDATFQGLIVTGKDMNLSKQEAARLKWRTEKVLVDSKFVSCISFDTLRDDFDFRLTNYHGV